MDVIINTTYMHIYGNVTKELPPMSQITSFMRTYLHGIMSL